MVRSDEDQSWPEEAEGESAKGVAELTHERKPTLAQIEVPELIRLQGGGVLKAIDEEFTVNAANGAAPLVIVLLMTLKRDGFNPDVEQVYSASAANSSFGTGWNLNLLAVPMEPTCVRSLRCSGGDRP